MSVVTSSVLCLIFQAIFLIQTEDVADFNEVLFFEVYCVIVLVKMRFVITRRNDILSLRKILLGPLMRPVTTKEVDIENKYNYLTK